MKRTLHAILTGTLIRRVYWTLVGGLLSCSALTAGVHTFADHSALAEGNWLKVSLNDTEDGIYQVTYDQLRNWGFSDPEQVAVYGFGGHALDEAFSDNHIDDLPEVAVYHDAARQRILFFGRGLVTWQWRNTSYRYVHSQHPYATQSVYFLHQKAEGDAPATMELQESGTLATSSAVQYLYDALEVHEQETTNIGRSGREFYGESFLYTQSQTFPFDVTGADNSYKAQVTANFIASASSSTRVQLWVDGTQVTSGTLLTPANSYYFATETTMNHTATVPDDGTMKVTMTYVPGSVNVTRAHLNYIRVQYKRKIALYDHDYTVFRRHETAATPTFRLDSTDAATLQVWDVTSPYAVRRQELTEGGFRAPDARERTYVLLRPEGTFEGVTAQGWVSNQDLHALEPCDMVIITAPALQAQAERLAAYRRSHDGLKVEVLTPEPIYNEFSSGVPDATAYRLLLKMLYDRGQEAGTPLRYLLLLGDGSYDNRSVAYSNNYLLTYESEASLIETASYVCDDYFAFLDDNEGGKRDNNYRYTINTDLVDIGVGRIPVSSLTAAEKVIDKIINYSNNTYYGSWKNRLCFLADDDKIAGTSSDSPNAHVKHNDEMVSILQDKGYDQYIYQKIYLAAYAQTTSASGTDYPEAKKEFQEALKKGVLLVNYAGHGSTTAITHEQMMNTATAGQLSMKYLPLWITATCDFSRYDDDATSCGETLLFNPNGGAIALITTSRTVFASNNLVINRGIINHIFERDTDGTKLRLGDIIQRAKSGMGSDANKLNFCLLGDPSLTLMTPDADIEITTVNGDPIDTEGSLSLHALDRVTLGGRILTSDGTQTDTTFNGLIYPTLYDAAETVTADKGLYQEVYTFTRQTNKMFAGRDVVQNGTFSFDLIVPRDITYSSNPGQALFNLYACDEDGREGHGAFTHFTLNAGSTNTSTTDSIGPEVRALLLDNHLYNEQPTVGTTPYLYAELHDDSGFNTTGNSIGHDLSVTIRSTSNTLLLAEQYNLNDYFMTNSGDPTTGNVRFSIPELSVGSYEATFRVWDVYNNPTTVTFPFIVSDEVTPQAVLVQAYPTPAKVGESITFRVLHNQPESTSNLRIQVYTQAGVKVWEGISTTNSAQVVYTQDAEHPYLIDNSLTADEQSSGYGVSILQWSPQSGSGLVLAPGVYIYRAYISSGNSIEASHSKLLLIQ
jgi:hypothetical protein